MLITEADIHAGTICLMPGDKVKGGTFDQVRFHCQVPILLQSCIMIDAQLGVEEALTVHEYVPEGEHAFIVGAVLTQCVLPTEVYAIRTEGHWPKSSKVYGEDHAIKSE
jgi:hypothetical protein